MRHSCVLPLKKCSAFCPFRAILCCNDGTHGHGQVAVSVCAKEAKDLKHIFIIFSSTFMSISVNEYIHYSCFLPFIGNNFIVSLN